MDALFYTVQQMAIGIAKGTPIWVWPLLIVLISVGLRASRERMQHQIFFVLTPLFGLISINSALNIITQTYLWPIYIISVLAGALAVYLALKGWIISADGKWLHVRGEWLTLILLMATFSANFVRGFLEDVAPQVLEMPITTIALLAAMGFASGGFLGYPLRVFQARRLIFNRP